MRNTDSNWRGLIVIGLFGLGIFQLLAYLQGPAPQQPRLMPGPVGQQVQPLFQPEQAAAPVQRFMGYKPQPAATERFLRTFNKPSLKQQAPNLFRRSSDDRPVLLYRALYEAYAWRHGGQNWRVGAQGIGDCVSWGWAHGLDVHLAVMWKLGETSDWRAAATEAIYGGSRVEANGGRLAGYGDGSYGAAAAKFVRDFGVVFRQPYQGLGLDLSTYSAQRAKDWGNFGCGGRDDNGRLDNEAKRHPVRNVALVSSFHEAAAAISSGYPVPVCSGQGFTSQRDQDGFCRASGGWSHCMCFIGVRYGQRPGLLCLNSWGTSWVSGPKWPEDQPEGSFWVDASTAERMLSGRDSFAVSGYDGFPYRDLKHGDWVSVDPDDVRVIVRRNELQAAGQLYVLAP